MLCTFVVPTALHHPACRPSRTLHRSPHHALPLTNQVTWQYRLYCSHDTFPPTTQGLPSLVPSPRRASSTSSPSIRILVRSPGNHTRLIDHPADHPEIGSSHAASPPSYTLAAGVCAMLRRGRLRCGGGRAVTGVVEVRYCDRCVRCSCRCVRQRDRCGGNA